ncbi:MAG: Hpt domain-containing protein [bacterium]|nr:Hpt domain-containing protein [bacterium]
METPPKEQILRDIDEAAERMGLEPEELVEMIDDVLDDALSKIPNLKAAAEAGDAQQTSAVAHDIKGSTINYGIIAPSNVAKEIEIGKLDAVGQIPLLERLLLDIRAMNISG